MKTQDKLRAILSLIDDGDGETTTPNNDPVGQHICVLDRGFIYVGECSWSGDWLTISNAKNIRRWGTTNGLGQLIHGPTKETQLDECGTVRVMRAGVMHMLPCQGF